MAAALAAVLAAPGAGRAQPLPPPGDPAWQAITFPSIERHTRYEAVESARGPAWHAVADCASSGMVVDVGEVDLATRPLRLRWSWRVGSLPVPAAGADVSERTLAGDDFGARVYAIFAADTERMSTWLRWRHRIASRLLGRELPGHALSYVWARAETAGSDWRSPHTSPGHLFALRSGPATGWAQESVDLRADHLRSFGAPRTPLVAIGIMSDSDDTCSRAEAWFSGLRFERAAPRDP